MDMKDLSILGTLFSSDQYFFVRSNIKNEEQSVTCEFGKTSFCEDFQFRLFEPYTPINKKEVNLTERKRTRLG